MGEVQIRRPVVPDCCKPDDRHEPPGTRPAAYWYEYRAASTGLAGAVMMLCVECCAQVRMQAGQADPDGFAPPPTRIGVLRDANTQEPVI